MTLPRQEKRVAEVTDPFLVIHDNAETTREPCHLGLTLPSTLPPYHSMTYTPSPRHRHRHNDTYTLTHTQTDTRRLKHTHRHTYTLPPSSEAAAAGRGWFRSSRLIGLQTPSRRHLVSGRGAGREHPLRGSFLRAPPLFSSIRLVFSSECFQGLEFFLCQVRGRWVPGRRQGTAPQRASTSVTVLRCAAEAYV